ncbi:hypothetical protein KC19_10G116400 [Ceratodon purpureus]|uniref:Uncharacterized protein n=1 Tax=Ceratodon purpureus TaxID=3225 RepID=A0A8T0GMX9_CERPU|nr:hypothetical protein KC19_10G116400 [Ceratodon purpureus]
MCQGALCRLCPCNAQYLLTFYKAERVHKTCMATQSLLDTSSISSHQKKKDPNYKTNSHTPAHNKAHLVLLTHRPPNSSLSSCDSLPHFLVPCLLGPSEALPLLRSHRSCPVQTDIES